MNGLLAGFVLFVFALLGHIQGQVDGFRRRQTGSGFCWFLRMAKGIAAATLAFWIGAIVGVALLYSNKEVWPEKQYRFRAIYDFRNGNIFFGEKNN